MRYLLPLLLLAVLTVDSAGADDVFRSGKIFPGPNPEVSEILPDVDPDTSFRIGQIVFDYPDDQVELAEPVMNLSQLQSVAEVVERAAPGRAIAALVEQQLTFPHDFEFASAIVKNHGDAGLVWTVTYELFPKMGGFSGVPFQYRAVVDGRGRLRRPRLTVIDEMFHSVEEGWTCSFLHLPGSPEDKETVLNPEEIRGRAMKALATDTKNEGSSRSVRNRMEYDGQQLVRIPVSTDKSGETSSVEIWAVNFRDPRQKVHPKDRFTVWVTPSGRTADIRQLDCEWGATEPTQESQSAPAPVEREDRRR
jgi:hypothetical protein